MKNRYFKVKVGSTLSDLHPQEMGVQNLISVMAETTFPGIIFVK